MTYCPYQDDDCIFENQENINCSSCIWSDDENDISLYDTEDFYFEDDPNNIYFEDNNYFLQIINNEDFTEFDKNQLI